MEERAVRDLARSEYNSVDEVEGKGLLFLFPPRRATYRVGEPFNGSLRESSFALYLV